jgi:hypothetical protein
VTSYVNLSPDFANPADSASSRGAKITIDSTSKWNGQTMLRTELIPQTSAAINKGKKTYHFSVKTAAENAPVAANEHQIAFFESHFTELKYGGSSKSLSWCVNGVSKWDTPLVADEWHNVAYEIDFDAGQVTFWHSTGSAALEKIAGPEKVSAQSNGADWHVGVLRLPGSNDGTGAEDWFFSGVFVEDGDVTKEIGAGGQGSKPVASSAAAVVVTSTKATSTPVVAAPSTLITRVSSTKAVETPVVQSTAVAVESPVAASSVAAVVTPVASSTAAKATPTASSAPSTGSGSGSGSDAVLPEKFTIKQFVAWLKKKQGMN